jgi:hypothetical protein
MTRPTVPQTPKSALRIELEDFARQLGRLGNCLLNKNFDLSAEGVQRRGLILVVLFLALGVLFTLISHSLGTWLEQIENLFRYLLNAAFRQQFPDVPIQFLKFVLDAIFGPLTLRYLPVFFLPLVLALRAAATYLDDIFELHRVDIANRFILDVALMGGFEKLHITGGVVVDKDQESPIRLIGGPGRVQVALDSVALFEKPDGTPHIIDSSPESNKTLEGFERYRWSFDLRDQFLDLSEKDNSSVTSRSLDGIRTKATDVRLLYRLRRDDLQPTLQRPHPYVGEAVRSLVFNEARLVSKENVDPTSAGVLRSQSKQLPLQMAIILSLIRGELSKFMSRYKLTRYLASYGTPEYEKACKREEEINEISQSVADPDDPAEPQEIEPPPEFEPRPKITSLFTEFTNAFTTNAKENGVELHWIGVGTWKPPNEIVPAKHIEAWRISMENLGRGSEDEIKGFGQDIKTQKKIHLIQDVPLARFKKERTDKKDRDFIIRDLLFAYREQLVKVKELLEESQRPVPEEICYAINYIDSILQLIWVGKGNVPPQTTIDEETWYKLLLQIIGNDPDRAEVLIEDERKKGPNAERRELIRSAIIRLLTDNT